MHYFDHIYDDEKTRNEIRSDCPQNIIFKSIPYETPSFLKEKELFYNRKDIWYVRQSFPIARKGYLHMCHFMSNYYGYPNTEFEQYDYIMTLDDESMFMKEMPYNPFETMASRPENFGALKIYDQTKRPPHQGNFDTRINLWKFIQAYLKQYNLKPKSQFLIDLLKDPENDKNFHRYPIANSYIIKLKMFETDEWKQWINAVNKIGGIYKYRWGDNDVNSLFYLIHYDHDIYDFKAVEEEYLSLNALRHLQDYAPGVKDNSK